jgi:hypothetical protein
MLKLKNGINNRDESSPRSPDSACESGGERAPSDREKRWIRWNLVRAQQAIRSNATAHASFREESAQTDFKFDVQEDLGSNQVFHKSSCNINPSSNLHSQSPGNQESESPSGDVDPTFLSGPLKHKTRESNLSDLEKNQQQRINFPKSGDIATWKEVDHDLKETLPLVFTKKLLRKMDSSQLSQKLDIWLYHYFSERFGVIDNADRDTARSKGSGRQFRHRGLERLRRKKNELRKAYKTLCKNDQLHSSAAKLLYTQWKSVMRAHNRLRLAVSKRNTARARVSSERNFKRDPHHFAAKLFKDSKKNEKPTFSREKATEYFSSTYRDNGRGDSYDPLPDLPTPPAPSIIFKDSCPTLIELRESVYKKSNKAAAGINGLSYVPYKKCRSIMFFVLKIVEKIWESQIVPSDWAQAFIILLSKSDILDDPAEFRPIAITNTVGKIFFSIVSDRLQKFLLANKYIRRSLQKGFLSGVPGCLEHSFSLYEALRNAKSHQRQIVVAWIDLANAYGSVRHNLIQFALEWYHVPLLIRNIVFDYYDKLMAKVQTSDWSTGFFLFDIGLFQGCVLSTILFDLVFQLLLDLLEPLSDDNGYNFKEINRTNLLKAYADDLALNACSPRSLQLSCDKTDVFLNWTGTMKAKPRKCVTMGFRQFDKRTDSGKFRRHKNTKYSPFDPNVFISGHKMKFIFNDRISKNEADPKKRILRDHFKFLGRWISIDLNEIEVRNLIRDRFLSEIKLVNSSKVSGFMKLWLYQHYILSHLAWPFIIHDLSLSFASELHDSIKTTLKKWAGLYRSADVGSLFRSKDLCGLGLTSVKHFFCKMQLIRCSLLENAVDSEVCRVYAHRAAKTSEWKVKWSANKIYRSLDAEVFVQSKFPTQNTRLGLGHGVFKGNPSKADIRSLITKSADKVEQEKMLAHSIQLERQGNWTSWNDKVTPFDLSWKNLIYGPSERVISFVMNATINCVRSPDMLKLWGYKSQATCKLCGADVCSLHHILSNCKTALKQQRYTWRHDSVLSYLHVVLVNHLVQLAKTKQSSSTLEKISFVKEGDKSRVNGKSQRAYSLLDGSTDWKLLVDFTKEKIVFPPEIYSTSERPDIVLYSANLHRVLLVELTCPAEEGIEAASIRKQARYLQLASNINNDNTKPWQASVFTIEAGARGFVAHSMTVFLRKIGVSPRRARAICKSISLICANCSYTIFLQKDAPHWDANRSLLPVP